MATVQSPMNRQQVSPSSSQTNFNLPDVFQECDHNAFRIYRMTQCEARLIMYKIFLFGCEREDLDQCLDEYLVQEKGWSMSKVKKFFNTSALKKIHEDPSGQTYDISLLFLCIKTCCREVADFDDDKWINADTTQLEYLLTLIKNFRNTLLHEKFSLSKSELIAMTTELRDLLTKTLRAAQVRYDLDPQEIDQMIYAMDQNMNKIRGEPLAQEDVAKYQNEILFEELKLLLLEYGVAELKEKCSKWTTVNPSSVIDGHDTKLDVNVVFTMIEIIDAGRGGGESRIPLKDILKFHKSKGNEMNGNTSVPKSKDDPTIFLIEGPAGAGKSTLIKMMISEWIKESFTIEGLANFDLLLCMECKDSTLTSFAELVNSLMPMTDAKRFRPGDLLKCALRLKILLVVDGLDELNSSSEILFNEILNIQKTADITVLCTTRPEKVKDFYMIVPVEMSKAHVKILGIPSDKREEFIEKYHEQLRRNGKSTQTTSGLTRFLRKSSSRLQEHWRLPLNLVLLTVLWAIAPHKVKDVTSATELYKDIMEMTKEKLLQRLMKNKNSWNLDLTNVREKIETFLQCVYRESLITLRWDEVILLDESTQRLQNICSAMNLPPREVISAFLVRQIEWATTGCLEQLTVPHKGIQDFYASLHVFLILLGKESLIDIIKIDQIISRTLNYYKVPASISKDILSYTFGKLNGINKPQSKIFPWFPLTNGSQKTKTVRSVFEDLHKDDPGSLKLTKYQNVLINLCGLLGSHQNAVEEHVAKELVQLLMESGINDQGQWLDVLSEVKLDKTFAKFIAEYVPEMIHGSINIRDGRVDVYAALLPYGTPMEVSLKIVNDPGSIPWLPRLMEVLTERVLGARLYFYHNFENPQTSTSVDKFLIPLLKRVWVSSYTGTLGADAVMELPNTVVSLNLAVASNGNASNPIPFLSSISQQLPHLTRFWLHIVAGMNIDFLQPLPSLRPLHISLSDVEDHLVTWACDAAHKLMPLNGTFTSIKLPRCLLSLEGLETFVGGLRRRGVKIHESGGLEVSRTHTRTMHEDDLVQHTWSVLNCDLILKEEASMWP